MPVQKRDFCESASYSNPPMEKSTLPQDPREQQLNRDFCVDFSHKNVPVKITECCDKQNARYLERLKTQTSFYHSPNCRETLRKSCEENETPIMDARRTLANSDNNNRPNKTRCESLHNIAQSDITGEGAVDESLTAAITRLREILHRDMSSVGQEMSQVKQQVDKVENKVEKVVTNVRELSDVVDHDIMKRDQESEQRQQQ
ncbi:MAG: hypothetical protein GY821_09530, partial [Gammaproteobacteria bacterium]|nr:hypothetical protein [Gammaproteobacteria bacterium]